MALTVVDHNTAAESVGAAFRRQRPGPEAELVSAFLENFPFEIPRGCHATVFCEPRIESGFPDLVVVFWSVATANKWRQERAELNQQDIRLVHYLHDAGPKTQSNLIPFFSRGLAHSLERLEAAHLIRQVKDAWKPLSIWDSFAVRRIIAVEAKISEWSEALDQAHLNTWFASDSFVLMPKNKHQPHVKAAARSKGVRLCTAPAI
jgi:hypothetical protein